jgi:prevent-host-death family protein
MARVGVRELKTHASEIIRAVREERARYLITYRGRPVGLLIPLDEVPEPPTEGGQASNSDAWNELTQLGIEIGQNWGADESPAEILSGTRR